jgi:RNA polymerase sigma-70 factor (ECF subfamily)
VSVPQETDIPQIIEKAREGNQKAFSQLLDRFWPEVYGFQLKRTQNENDAEDITIQTFARAFDKIDTYDPRFGFNTWLITISKNLHVDLLRRRRRNVLQQTENAAGEAMREVMDDAPSAEDRLITEQNLKTLLHYLKSLKPPYRDVIELRYFRELSYAEIARELNEPVGNVKVKLLRAKKLLASLIDGGRKGD